MKLMEALMMRRKWLRLERQRWALDGMKWGQAIRRSILSQTCNRCLTMFKKLPNMASFIYFKVFLNDCSCL